MSTSEIKKTAEELSSEERAYLAAYLQVLDRIQDAGYLAELARRKQDVQEGRLLTRDAVVDLHLALERKGL